MAVGTVGRMWQGNSGYRAFRTTILDERLMLILGWQKSYAFIKLDSSALLLAKSFQKNLNLKQE